MIPTRKTDKTKSQSNTERPAKKALFIATTGGFLSHFEKDNAELLREMGYEVIYAANYSYGTYGVRELSVSDEAERVYQHDGMNAFREHEQIHAEEPLPKGPFANFLMMLSNIQDMYPEREGAPIRTALVTSRGAPAHERAIRTLRAWHVRVDEAFFLGGVQKKDVLQSFGADIFFDDQSVHTDPAAEVVPSALVPYRSGDDPRTQEKEV